MGSCFSVESDFATLTTAKIISLYGTLREHPVPVKAAQVLRFEASPSSCFICSSNKLYFDQHITPMKPDEELELGQIYFVLHKSKLRSPLAASDMAALAVKASRAMAKSSMAKRRRKRIRVSPVVEEGKEAGKRDDGLKKLDAPATTLSRAASMRRLRRSTSRRRQLAAPPFRSKLRTIHEGLLID